MLCLKTKLFKRREVQNKIRLNQFSSKKDTRDSKFEIIFSWWSLMENIQDSSTIDTKFENWFKVNYPTDTDREKEYRESVNRQYKVFLSQYLLQIVFFIGAAVFPWYLFVKNVSEPIAIYAGAIHLNDWTLQLLLIGSGLSLIACFLLLFRPSLSRRYIRLLNLGFIGLFIPIWTSFMDPRFAPGALGHFQESVSLYLISILSYTIKAQLGYILMILCAIVVCLGFLLSIFWDS